MQLKYFTTNSHQKDSIQEEEEEEDDISVKSCFITVPETINIKNNFKAEIIQKWDGKVINVNTIASHFLDSLGQKSESKKKATNN